MAKEKCNCSRVAPDFSVEDKKRQLDFNNIAGIDEAGRGPWAGPVYSAIVILNRNCIPDGINDSKKISELISLSLKTLSNS